MVVVHISEALCLGPIDDVWAVAVISKIAAGRSI